MILRVSLCFVFACAAGWSRRAASEARPWWRRGSSSWRWVSAGARGLFLGVVRVAAMVALCASPREVDIAPHTQVSARVFECTSCSCKCAAFVRIKRTGKEIRSFFAGCLIKLCVCVSSRRSSELWRHQTVDLQDGLQAALCAEEMQPWVHVEQYTIVHRVYCCYFEPTSLSLD